MSQAKTLAKGFAVTASVACLFVTFVWLPSYLNLAVGLTAFVFLALFFSTIYLLIWNRSKQKKTDDPAGVKKAKNVLMALQGFGFACWFFDVLSTIIVINIKKSGEELNILGWPFSALGALAFYVPMAFVVYYLLFKIKSKESFYGTVAVTVLTIFMGLGNLNASLFNMVGVRSFEGSFGDFAVLSIWVAVIATLAALNVGIARSKKTITAQSVQHCEAGGQKPKISSNHISS
jgi:hypothetical protein